MNIAVDARMIRASGIGTFIENVLQHLIEQQSAWYFFILGKTEELKEIHKGNNQNVTLIDCRAPIYSIREQVEIPVKTPKNIDVFWSPHFNVPVLCRSTLIVTIHDVAHLALQGAADTVLKKIYAAIMYRAAVWKSARVTCVSQFTAHEIEKYIGVPERPIQLLYNAVDESWYHIKKTERKYVAPYFVYVGNIKPHKNLRRLILAYREAAKNLSEDLLLIGKKEGFITGDDGIEDLLVGFEDRIHFTGYVSDSELKQYIAWSEGLILLSLYEGFGLPPLEAMATGKKALLSDIPVFHEVYGDSAMYVDPYDVRQIAKKIQEFSSTSYIPEKLREKAATYSWDRTASEFVKIVKEVYAEKLGKA